MLIIEAEGDGDGGIDFRRLAIEEIRPVRPLLYRFECCPFEHFLR